MVCGNGDGPTRRRRGHRFRHHAAARTARRCRTRRFGCTGVAASRPRLDGALRAGTGASLAGRGPPDGRRDLVHPARPGPDVATPGSASGDGRAGARYLRVHSAGTHFQFRASDGAPLTVVGVTMPPWPGDDEAYEVPGTW